MGYLNIQNRKWIELLTEREEDSLQPLDWGCAGKNIYNMYRTFIICLVFVLVWEAGAYKFIGRPLIGPLWIRIKHAFKFLGRRKKPQLYNIRKDFDYKDLD